MLVPSDMIGAQSKLMNQLEKYQAHQVRYENAILCGVGGNFNP
jgi:hypothetical protein